MGLKSRTGIIINDTLQKKLDKDKKISKSYRKFLHTIPNPKTRREFVAALDRFMQFTKFDNYDKIGKMDTDSRQDFLEDFMLMFGNMSHSYGYNHLCAFGAFAEINRITYFRRPAQKLLPKSNDKLGGDTPYTLEEIQRMLEKYGHIQRTKALVLYYSNTTARTGTIFDQDGFLQIKNTCEMADGCIGLTLYADTKFEFYSFLTPEGAKAMRSYWQWRVDHLGENLCWDPKDPNYTPDSPVFGIKNKNPKPLNADGAGYIIKRVLNGSDIKRTKPPGKVRYDKAQTYGFRKFGNTVLKLGNDINSNIAEKIMAHSRGLDGVYFKPTMEQCFAEFRKAIPELTIDDKERLQYDNFKLKAEDNKTTRDKVLQVFDLAESDVEEFKEFVKQKRKDRKYK